MLEGTPKVIDMNDKYINHVERLTNLLKSDQLNQETKIEIEDTIQAYLRQMQQLQIMIPLKNTESWHET